jgi:hypothetical protein
MSAKRPLWRTFIININNLMNTIHLQASRVISLPGPPGGRLKNVTAQISLYEPIAVYLTNRNAEVFRGV